jgi:hypothetical protein
MDSLKQITLAVGVIVLASVPAAAQSLGRGYYLTPSAPYAPTTYAECSAHEREWQAIRNSVELEHTACLADAQKLRCGSDTATGCSCAECAPFHNASQLGRTAVNACRETVQKYLQDELRRRQKEQDELRRQQEERDRRDAQARATEQLQREEKRADARRREAEVQRQTERRDRQRREGDAIRSMVKTSEAMKSGLQMRTGRREEEKARLEDERASVDRTYDAALNRVADAAQGLIGDVRKMGEGPRDSGAPAPASPETEFNLNSATGIAKPPAANQGAQLGATIDSANRAFRGWIRGEVRGAADATARALIDDFVGDESVSALVAEAYSLQEPSSARIETVGARAFNALFAPAAMEVKRDFSKWVNESLRTPTDRVLNRPWAGDFGNALVQTGVGMVINTAMESIRHQVGVRVQQGVDHLFAREPAPPEGTLERLEYDVTTHADLPSLASKTFPLTGPAALKGLYDYKTTLVTDMSRLLGFFVDGPGSQAAR